MNSIPEGAELSTVDGDFTGNSPATLRLTPGKHSIALMLNGYKRWIRDLSMGTHSIALVLETAQRWIRDLSISPGSDLKLAATLEKE